MIAIDPVTPVALSAGLSIAPNGAAADAPGSTPSDTVMGSTTFDAPVAAMVMVAEAAPLAGAAAGTSETVSAPEPVPDAGDTVSQALFDAAVQVTAPAPVCVSRTVCEAVRNAALPATMANDSAPRSGVRVDTGPSAVADTLDDGSLRSPLALYATTRNR